MTSHKILVAGIGNIFFGDDAFGIEVVRRLAGRPLPPEVRVADFGIRGFDLVCALLDGYALVVLVDAAQRGENPGTLFVLDPDTPGHLKEDCVSSGGVFPEPHGLHPAKVLELARTMGEIRCRIRLVCCEPRTLEAGCEESAGLSEPVAAAISPAVALIEDLIARFLETEAAHA